MTKSEFNKLIISQEKHLKRYALKFTHDQEDANDLVQETMLKAITSCENFRADTNLKAWLFTIMKNSYINNYKRLVKKSQMVVQAEEITCNHLMYSSSKNAGESKFVMDDLQWALTKLPAEYGNPFTMYFEGYKYHEIADQLFIPIGTVKTRIFMARKILKNSLKPYNITKIGTYELCN
jgi:RNA polymerase sigma factor (sigma-70 family)